MIWINFVLNNIWCL